MTEKTKNILLGVLIVGLVSMTVAYAALTQTLTINSSAVVQNRSTSWNVHFQANTLTGHNPIETSGYATVASGATLTLSADSTVITTPTVTLKAPGDKVDFYFDVINEGEIHAKIATGGITGPTLGSPTWNASEPADNKDAIVNAVRLSLVDASTGNALSAGERLPFTSGSNVRHLKLTIELDSELEVLPTYDVTFSGITAAINYTQDTVSGN